MNNFNVPLHDLFHLYFPFKQDESLIDLDYLLTAGKKRDNQFIYIDILCAIGRNQEQKKNLYRDIVNNIEKQTGISGENIFITLTEIAQDNWSFGEGSAQLIPSHSKNQ